LPSPDLDTFWQAVGDVVDECEQIAFGDARQQTGILRMQFVLPNQHGSQRLSVAIRYGDSQQWVPVASEVFKPLPQNDGAFYEVWLPIASDRAIAACRLESWGYGGMGLTYVEAINKQGRFSPVQVAATEGKIRDVDNLLADNLNWAWIGEPDANVPFFDMAQGRVKHSIDLALSFAKKN
jgi:hypothetical protein